MSKIIIADSTCLILLDNINEFELLKSLFSQVIITSVIAGEFRKPLPEWVIIKDPINVNYQTKLEASVDKGEASAIALAIEQTDCLLILDDLKARKLATELKLKHTGTLALIVDAKTSGYIHSVKPLLQKIKKTNFHITSDLERKILDRAGE